MPPKAKKSKKEIEEEKSNVNHSYKCRETRGRKAYSRGTRKETLGRGRASEEDRGGEETRRGREEKG
jgi:hypothetical protein